MVHIIDCAVSVEIETVNPVSIWITTMTRSRTWVLFSRSGGFRLGMHWLDAGSCLWASSIWWYKPLKQNQGYCTEKNYVSIITMLLAKKSNAGFQCQRTEFEAKLLGHGMSHEAIQPYNKFATRPTAHMIVSYLAINNGQWLICQIWWRQWVRLYSQSWQEKWVSWIHTVPFFAWQDKTWHQCSVSLQLYIFNFHDSN